MRPADLQRLGEDDVLALLRGAVGEGEERQLLARLAEVGTDASVDPLRRRALGAPTQEIRDAAVVSLNKVKTESAEDAMVALLAATDPRLVSFVAWMLGVRGQRSPGLARRLALAYLTAMPTLAKALRDPHPATVRMAVRALLLIPTSEAQIELESAVHDLPWRQRRLVRRALQRRSRQPPRG